MRAKCLPRSPRNSLTFRTQDSLCSEVNQDIVVEAMFRSSSGHFHSSTAETQSGLPFVLHLRQKSNLFVFSFFLVYNNV